MPDTFPYDPDWNSPLTVSKPAIFSRAVSGKIKGRSKGTKKRGWELHFESRDETEAIAARAFWDAHYPVIAFNYVDRSVASPVTISVQIIPDSVFNELNESYNLRNYSFSVVEV